MQYVGMIGKNVSFFDGQQTFLIIIRVWPQSKPVHFFFMQLALMLEENRTFFFSHIDTNRTCKYEILNSNSLVGIIVSLFLVKEFDHSEQKTWLKGHFEATTHSSHTASKTSSSFVWPWQSSISCLDKDQFSFKKQKEAGGFFRLFSGLKCRDNLDILHPLESF